jgi:nucleoside diphosphate kinase
MATETTLVLVKPDGVRRGLCGEITARFEQEFARHAGHIEAYRRAFLHVWRLTPR